MTLPEDHCAVRLLLAADEEDEASGRLWTLAPEGLEILQLDAAGRLPLLAYFKQREGLLEAVRASLLPLAPLELRLEAVPAIDWVQRFRENFTAFDAGPFRIVPVWDLPTGAPLELRVDPGRAFGTGTHETTRLCLQAIDALAHQAPLGRTVDIGAGTGILAVAAARRGASYVVALDNDPEATGSVGLHAELNQVQVGVLLASGAAGLRAGCFDTVLANLMAPLLLELRPDLFGLLASRGRMVLSGLLVSDLPEIAPAFAPHASLETQIDGEWAALIVRT